VKKDGALADMAFKSNLAETPLCYGSISLGIKPLHLEYLQFTSLLTLGESPFTFTKAAIEFCNCNQPGTH
jgi:hypothetical protein